MVGLASFSLHTHTDCSRYFGAWRGGRCAIAKVKSESEVASHQNLLLYDAGTFYFTIIYAPPPATTCHPILPSLHPADARISWR